MSDLLRLIVLFGSQWRWMALASLVSLIAVLANIGLMAVAGWFITAMAAAGLTGASLNYFTPSALIRLAAILRTGGRYAERLVSHEATFRLLARLRTYLFARLVPLVPGASADLSAADLAVRLKDDVDRLELVFLRLVAPFAVALATALVVAAGLASIDMRLGASIGAVFAIALLAVPAIAIAGWPTAQAAADAAALLKQRTLETLTGLAPLIVTGAVAGRLDALRETYLHLTTRQRRMMQVATLGTVGIGFLGDAALWAAVALGLALHNGGQLSGPGLTMVALTAMAAFEAFAALPDAAAGLYGAITSARRLFALIDRAPPVALDGPAPDPAGGFDLALEGVGFAVEPDGPPILAGIDLVIPAGHHVALVGPSGAGKSSLFQLLTRLLQPTSGTIRLGGTPINWIDEAEFRRTVSALSQEPHVFTATIAENLRLAAPDASDATLWEVLRQAGLDDLVRSLPDGLATPVGSFGERLSGGELRRLALARVLLRNTPIALLDEPTEGLDPLTAARVVANLERQFAGRTLIVSTHKTDALLHADRIVTLEDGQIVAAPGRLPATSTPSPAGQGACD
ncbi:MAG: thiol reductant ABC exporter subunit CydC [Ancalomicrobiaceae bacterium]|nr:thiol reductant ABC exporter subunit CydC [Ancalomicrobiaceae bacterium]